MNLSEIRQNYKMRLRSPYKGLYIGLGFCLLIIGDIVDHRELILGFISLIEEVLIKLYKCLVFASCG